MTTLFDPLTAGALHLANRIAMAPLTRNRAPGAVPNALMAELHNRMPVIVARDDYATWLGSGKDATPRELGDLQHLLRPYPAEEMTCWPVSANVGNPRNQGAELIESVKRQFERNSGVKAAYLPLRWSYAVPTSLLPGGDR